MLRKNRSKLARTTDSPTNRCTNLPAGVPSCSAFTPAKMDDLPLLLPQAIPFPSQIMGSHPFSFMKDHMSSLLDITNQLKSLPKLLSILLINQPTNWPSRPHALLAATQFHYSFKVKLYSYLHKLFPFHYLTFFL